MGFAHHIVNQPDFAMLTVDIPAQQTLQVEASSMAAMDPHLEVKAKFRGGLGRFLTGESLFTSHYTARTAPGQIWIAPGTPGDIRHQTMNSGEKFYIASSNYLASTLGVSINSRWQGLSKGIFSGTSFFIMECSGQGDLWFNSYGAMMEIDVQDEWLVDTGHIVAFSGGLAYSVSMLGGYKSLFFSGEGLVARFRGRGKVWVQTKKGISLAVWADAYRPVSRDTN
jgi:uncharacterized protein (TIGR00266 family)